MIEQPFRKWNSEMKNHKYYKQAVAAYYGTSFDPEKRAESELAWYDSVVKELTDSGKESAIEKFTKLWLKNMAAMARIVSPMISGPANFPVARMEKYNRWQHNAMNEVMNFLNKVRNPKPSGPMRTEIDYKIEEKEYQIGEVTVRQNVTDNRLQLTFPGKPEAEMIATLKKNGFKWSPRNKVWQRQLTPNALSTVNRILK